MDNLPEQLCANQKDSLAFIAFTGKLPEILVKVISFFHRVWQTFIEKSQKYKDQDMKAIENDSKNVISRLSKLRYEVMTDKCLEELNGSASDIEIWNNFFRDYIKKNNRHPTYFTASWLYSECFIYRKIQEIFDNSTFFIGFDPFYTAKRNVLIDSIGSAISLGEYILDLEKNKPIEPHLIKEECIKFIEVSLWGNKCDLSMSGGAGVKQEVCILDRLTPLRKNILINHSKEMIEKIFSISSGSLDIVLDNSGFELFTDLCMIEIFYLFNYLSKDKITIRFYPKKIPWYVSDVLDNDFYWLLDYLKSHNSKALKTLGERWKENVSNGNWKLIIEDFWTLPFEYALMQKISPKLYEQLSQANLIIFKGDLNYRKLVGDRLWTYDTTFERALNGFTPAPLVSLRTIKADVCVGLQKNSWLNLPKDWMSSSDYSVIHYYSLLK